MDIAPAIFFVGLLIFLAHLFTGIFSRTKIPDVLFLMIIGLLVGPLLGIFTAEQFGELGAIFASITLIVILFQSGLYLKLDVLKKSLKGTVSLTLTNFLVTMLIVGGAVYFLAGFDIIGSLMLGAILGGTSSAVVIPLVNRLIMKEESKTILFLESALSDVLCIVVAIGFLESLKYGNVNLGLMVGKILGSFILASLFGVVSAVGWSIALNKVRALENPIFMTPAFVFIVFGVVEMLGYSGAIAALAFGVMLGNVGILNSLRPLFMKNHIDVQPIALNSTEKIFFSEVEFLLKTFFFVFIGISIVLTNMAWIYLGLIITLVIFYFRVPIVFFSVPKSTPATDVSIMAIMTPKGLAAAVLASMPLQAGIAGGEFIQSITYSVILFSIFLNCILVFLVEKTKVSTFYTWMFSKFGRISG